MRPRGMVARAARHTWAARMGGHNGLRDKARRWRSWGRGPAWRSSAWREGRRLRGGTGDQVGSSARSPARQRPWQPRHPDPYDQAVRGTRVGRIWRQPWRSHVCVSGVARHCGRGGAARYDARRASSLPRRRTGGSDVRARDGRGGWHPLPLPQARSGWVLGRWRVEFPPAQIRQKSARTARWWLAWRASKKVARAEVLAGKGGARDPGRHRLVETTSMCRTTTGVGERDVGRRQD
jgi:hypothetical protein